MSTERISLEDQIAEAMEHFARIAIENAQLVDAGSYDGMHAVQRQKRAEAILGTLKWMQENEEMVRRVYREIKADSMRATD